MANAPYQNSRYVQLKGPKPFNGLRLLRMTGREAISEPFAYELILLGTDGSEPLDPLSTEKVLGYPLAVALLPSTAVARNVNGLVTGFDLIADKKARYFNGIVTEFAYRGSSGGYHQYRVVLRPSLWLLTRRVDCRIFQKKLTKDVFADVCQRAGSFPYRWALTGQSYKPREFCVQYRESDFDFVSRLLEHEGIYYYFEHSADKHELVLTDDVASLTAAQGYEEVPFYPRTADQAQRERDHLNVWSANKSFQSAGFATTEYDFESALSPVSGASAVTNRSDSSKYEIFEYPAGTSAPDHEAMEALVKRRAERLYTAQSSTHFEGDAAGLGAGRVFELSFERAQNQRAKQKYVIVSTACSLTCDPDKTDHASQFSIALEAVAANEPYRPERVTPKPLIQGTQTARVVGPKDKEIHTDTYGRVKVQFHWDRVGKYDDNSSCWVRVAQGWAGKSWGSQHVPRVGQEVVVSFLEGDPDRPLVIGSVYNSDQMPPYALPDNATQSGVKSRSSDKGTAENFNELRFDDKKDSEQIYLHAEKDLVVLVNNDQTITVGAKKDKDKGNRTTSVNHDDQLTVENDLTVTVKGKETRTVTKDRATSAKANDSLDVSKQYKLTAGDSITLECGQAKLTLKSDGTVEISGSSLKLSGTQKVAVDGTQTKISGSDVSISGTKAAVQGSGTLDLSSSGVASLKGSLTKIG